MCRIFELIRSHMFYIVLFATFFQVSGTLVLALFSFYGLKITENKEAYIEGVQKVEIKTCWLRASQAALLLLVIGIVFSGLASLASLS